MASTTITLDMTKWPEVIHAIRREVVGLLMGEAEDSSPEVAAALQRVAMRLDAGLTDVAEVESS